MFEDDDILVKYIYYYLYVNIHILANGFAGATIKHLSKDYLNNLNIPIPTLDMQNKII